MLAAVIGLYVVSASSSAGHVRLRRAAPARHHAGRRRCSSASSSRSRSRRRSSRSTPGCPTPVARHRRRRGAAGRRPGQGRHVRLPAVLPAAVPRRVTFFAPLGAGARAGRHHLRRAARDRAERHETAGVLHVDLALRLHRARHLRVHHRGCAPAPCSTWSTTASRPGCCSSSSACSSPAAAPGRSATSAAGRKGAGAGGRFLSPAWRRWRCRAPQLRQRVPGADRHVHGEPAVAIVATAGIILAARYILWMFQRTMQGPPAGVLLVDDPGDRRRRPGGGATAVLTAPRRRCGSSTWTGVSWPSSRR